MSKQPVVMRPAEVAELFQVDPKTVNRWAKAGKLAGFRTPGGQWRFLPETVREALATGTGESDA